MSRPPTFNLSTFLEKDKLKTDGTNFTAWFRNLRILLVPYKLTYVIEAELPAKPADSAPRTKRMSGSPWQTISPSSRVECSMPWSRSFKSVLRR